MDNLEFQTFCDYIGLKRENLGCNLETLNILLEKNLEYVHYSTIPVQLYPKMEVKIEWGNIFRRLVVEKRGGLCYERNEVLYQALIIMGFKVHRMECQYTDRFDHMGLVIHLDGRWYFCDGGYGGITPHNVLELVSGKEMECKMGSWRVIGMYEHGPSTLDPSLPKEWRLERKHHDTVFVDYDNYEKKAPKDTWTRDFDFTFEIASVSDFSLKCHKMHTDPDEFCNSHFLLARMGYTSEGVLYHKIVKGNELMTTEFLTSNIRRKTFHSYNDDELYDLTLKMGIHPDEKTWEPRNKCGSMICDPRTS